MMYDNDSKGISFTAGFFMLIAFAVAGVIIASAMSIPIWTNMTGRPFADMEKGLTDPAYGNVARLLQTITAVFGFFIPALVTASLLNRKPFKLLGYNAGIKLNQVVLVIVIMVAALVVSSALSYFNNIIPVPPTWKITFDKLENSYNAQVTAIVGLHSPAEYILALVIMAFLPAVCEETLFRGGLQNFLTRSSKMPLLSIIIVSIIFSAIHFSWYGFLSRFFLGFILGYIYHYSGKIWLNILLHFLNNALAITALYYHVTDHEGSSWGLVALPVLVLLLVVFKRISYHPAMAARA